ncbi:hypothetical protein GCM10025751_37800 [Haladaptatus pallidirubidus]|uniref:Uncharacterized protein n=1 Tax=Haladaptatus pallidirubidus TaxID=1008152 RepID=A0AAV3ULA7_9EURY
MKPCSIAVSESTRRTTTETTAVSKIVVTGKICVAMTVLNCCNDPESGSPPVPNATRTVYPMIAAIIPTTEIACGAIPLR